MRYAPSRVFSIPAHARTAHKPTQFTFQFPDINIQQNSCIKDSDTADTGYLASTQALLVKGDFLPQRTAFSIVV